ncbi:MAG: integrating conjugative element protein [Cellvibrio sp. 79]|nr:MAG: integrating conjugative element protein [Cellvibrio sp. 79]
MSTFTLSIAKKIILGFLVVITHSTMAGDIVRPTGDGSWYYAIGGGDPMMYYHQSNKTTLNLSAGAEWNMFRGCSFDPSFGIAETFSDMKHNVYGLSDDVLGAATAVFSAWGLSKIQENWPGLYDTLTKGLKDAKETYTLSLKTCRDAKADLRAGRDPVEGWIAVTRKSSWDKASKAGENPVTAEESIEATAGNSGVTFAGGIKKGGLGQPPIRIVEDTIGAGYEHQVGSLAPEDPDDVTGDSNIARVFPTATSATSWATAVVGEREVRTCASCDKLKTKMGQGLRFQYRKEREVVSADLKPLMSKPLNYKMSAAELDKLSVPGMGLVINDLTIQDLKRAPLDEQAILANKLTGEIALARAMEKALIVRDLLNAGAQEPNIASVGDAASTEIDYSRQRLQAEIDNILFETEVRQKVITNAAGTIAQRGTKRNRDAGATDYMRTKTKEPRMIDGAISDE